MLGQGVFMNKIKSIIAFVFVSFVVMSMSFAESNREKIDNFFKSYEKLVVAAEKAASSNNMTDLMNLAIKVAELAEEVEAAESYEEWTMDDTTKYLNLSTRYAKAANQMSSNNIQTLDNMGALDDETAASLKAATQINSATIDALDALNSLDLSSYGF